MSEERVYVEYSDELRRALAKLNLDMPQLVREELAKDDIRGEVTEALDPTSAGSEDRDLFLLIIAGSVAVSMLAGAVARVIDAQTKRKATEGEITRLQVALDGNGKAIRDAAGNPVYNRSSAPAAVPESKPERTSVKVAKIVTFDFQR